MSKVWGLGVGACCDVCKRPIDYRHVVHMALYGTYRDCNN